MANKYTCSDGTRVSQATLDRKKSETYKKMYAGEPHPNCVGCGKQAQGSAHLVPQKVCKDEGIAEYCSLPINIVPACNKCNSILESYKSDEVKNLLCYEQLLEVTRKILPSRYLKMI